MAFSNRKGLKFSNTYHFCNKYPYLDTNLASLKSEIINGGKMKNKNLKLLVATSIVSGVIAANTALASTDATPENWKKGADSSIVDNEGDGCGSGSCGSASCGEKEEAPTEESGESSSIGDE